MTQNPKMIYLKYQLKLIIYNHIKAIGYIRIFENCNEGRFFFI